MKFAKASGDDSRSGFGFLQIDDELASTLEAAFDFSRRWQSSRNCRRPRGAGTLSKFGRGARSARRHSLALPLARRRPRPTWPDRRSERGAGEGDHGLTCLVRVSGPQSGYPGFGQKGTPACSTASEKPVGRAEEVIWRRSLAHPRLSGQATRLLLQAWSMPPVAGSIVRAHAAASQPHGHFAIFLILSHYCDG
jgi:hypothetical protein